MIKPILPYKNSYQTSFSGTKKTNKNDKIWDETRANKALMIAGLSGIAVFGTVAAIISSKQSATRTIDKISLLKTEMSKYAQDVAYRKQILRDMNLPETDYYKLRSIVGAEEFDSIVKELSKDKENFLPGKKVFRADKEPIFPNKENVETAKFAANLHLHTVYSDGTFTVPELMEQAAKYADVRSSKLGDGKPFYLAITDHDTMEGCKEALGLVLNNPEKYKNLRLILGVENTVLTEHSQYLTAPVETHMISYCINPFDKELANYYNKYLQQNRKNIENVLDFANEKYFTTLRRLSTGYTLEEFDKFAPEIKYRNLHANYLTKDYLQFRLIYSYMVEKNTTLLDSVSLKPEMLDFVAPRKLIGENLDYSNGQRYYHYYIEAVKQDLKSKLPKEEHSKVDMYLRTIPEEIQPILEEIEASVGNLDSNLYVAKVMPPKFDEAVMFLITRDGNLGIAHPGVAFPLENFKTEAETIKFYDDLYSKFKELGKEKARYAEDNYAVYFEDQTPEFLEKLAATSSKYGLDKTGGLDTHISDIFCSK